MSRQLFLHVGIPKTGSTSMQKWFWDNRKAMLGLGCAYPTEPALHDYKHVYTVSNLRSDPKLHLIKSALEQSKTDVLLSNEGMANHFHDFPAENLAYFREITTSFQTVVVMFRRDPDRWLHSYHRQAVLNPRNDASELWGTSSSMDEIRDHYRIKRLLDHTALATDMTREYGADACHVLDFDRPDAFSQMLAVMGLDVLAHIPLPRINQAVPDWVVTMMQRINAVAQKDLEVKAWRAALYHFLASNHTVLRNDALAMKPEDILKVNLELLNEMPPDVPVAALRSFICKKLPHHLV